jgi:hypothetical protein
MSHDPLPFGLLSLPRSAEKQNAGGEARFRLEPRIRDVLARPDGWLDCAREIARGREDAWSVLNAAQDRDSRKLHHNICRSLRGVEADEARAFLRTLARHAQYKQLGAMLIDSDARELQKFFSELGNIHLESQGIAPKIKEAQANGAKREYVDEVLRSPQHLIEYARKMTEAWKKLDMAELSERWAALLCAHAENPDMVKLNFIGAVGEMSQVGRLRMHRLTKIAGWSEFAAGAGLPAQLPERILARLMAETGD